MSIGIKNSVKPDSCINDKEYYYAVRQWPTETQAHWELHDHDALQRPLALASKDMTLSSSIAFIAFGK